MHASEGRVHGTVIGLLLINIILLFTLYLKMDSVSRLTMSTTNLSSRLDLLVNHDWRTYHVKGYEFLYPNSWNPAEINANRVDFLNQDGERVARLDCPILEIGYEGWDEADRSDRVITSNEKEYEIKSVFLKSSQPGIDPLNIIFMGEADMYSTLSFPGSCQLTSENEKTDRAMDDIFRKIFESVEVKYYAPITIPFRALHPERIAV